MKTKDFDYYLPPELIAQYPQKGRDECRLLCVGRSSASLTDMLFKELSRLVNPGDLLVLNDTKVIPARIFCRKRTGGAVELLFAEPLDTGNWIALVRPGRGLNPGTKLVLNNDQSVEFEIVSILEDGSRVVAASGPNPQPIEEIIRGYGVMALPHYIKRSFELPDNQSYQTVYAKCEGAVASPTAGLHFTESLLHSMKEDGINIGFVTLHVGVGTFRSVKVSDPALHKMHHERYDLKQETVEQINETKMKGGRVIAVGTTVVRVLEHCARHAGRLEASHGQTDLLILPGYEFKVIDGLITNFHVPQSTLLMLVSAFAGRDLVSSAYKHAIEEGYRFFSYGDAMAIL